MTVASGVKYHTSRLRQLTVDEEYCDSLPQWSPDGKNILFARLGNQSASLWFINSDGKYLRQVIPELTPKPDPLGIKGFSQLGRVIGLVRSRIFKVMNSFVEMIQISHPPN